MRPYILALTAFLLAALPAAAAAQTRDLAWAAGLTDADVAALSAPDLLEAGKLLWASGYYEPDAPVKPTEKGYHEALGKARTLVQRAVKKDPALLEAAAILSLVDYDYGEGIDDDDARLKIYDEMIAVSEACIKRDPKYADCYHWLATGIGRRSTTVGVINSALKASQVEKLWRKTLALKPTTVLPNGDATMTNARYGLTVFYRMVPDSWFIKMLTGTRGDKKKSVEYAREMVKAQPFRLELQKELGASLVCLGQDTDDEALVREGVALLKDVVAGKFDAHDLRLTDDIDKRHSKEMIAKPDLACGYSRDGYQDLDESKLKQ